ncbi:MAG TPA: prepilin-type N-terminal cleavage/methylation domain-containing protein [Candidatus Aquilonibacter sp.]|nr:prepilin-type N-terminal cleavage/methylation domain-containing protein [Candidatus Aquilonibacter sp.]
MRTAIPSGAGRRAFSLLEVMIAIGIFAVATFAILCLVSSSLENARRLQMPIVDAGMVASAYSQTNQLVEGNDSGDLSDFLGDAYQGYTWTSAVDEVESNKLFQVDLIVQSPAPGNPVISKMSILLYRPQSPAGSLDGATTAR